MIAQQPVPRDRCPPKQATRHLKYALSERGLSWDERGRQPRRPERFTVTTKIKEHMCEACKGRGFPVVMQPVQPGRKIYPAKCKACDGKGKITDAS